MNRETIKEMLEDFMWRSYHEDKDMEDVESFLTDTISNCRIRIEAGDEQ